MWRRLAYSSCVLGCVVACSPSNEAPRVGGRPENQPDDVFKPDVTGIEVTTVVSGLDTPWSIVFLPDGRVLISERKGTIKVARAGDTEASQYANVQVAHEGEGGLMGMAISPNFERLPYIYVMYTYRGGGPEGGELVNRVSRFKDLGVGLGDEEVIVDDILGGHLHNGGRIMFGPDNMLYVGTGEAFEKERAQDLSDLGGKVLRLTFEGRVPPDNPFPGSPVFSYGHRNVQGIAWHPSTGALVVGDHGPSGERWIGSTGRELRVRGYDEINLVTPGANGGWPLAMGAVHTRGLLDPIVVWPAPSVPPSGATFYTGDLIPSLRGDLFVATLAAEALLRVSFRDSSNPHAPTLVERWFATGPSEGKYGRLRDVAQGPDGALYVLTNSERRRRSGKLPPWQDGDHVLRLAPSGR